MKRRDLVGAASKNNTFDHVQRALRVFFAVALAVCTQFIPREAYAVAPLVNGHTYEAVGAPSLQVKAQAAVTYSDSEFADADWTLSVMTLGNGGTSVASRVGTGGNPGAFRQVTDQVNIAGIDVALVIGLHKRLGATYDPSMQGPIATIDYGEDDCKPHSCFITRQEIRESRMRIVHSSPQNGRSKP